MRRQMMALAASSALLCTGSTGPETVHHAAAPVETFSAHDAALAQSVFEDARRFWDAQQVGSMVTIRLVMLSGKETFVCHNATGEKSVLTALSTTQYCAGENTVVDTALQNNAINYYGGGALGNAFDISHEMGHGDQNAMEPDMMVRAMKDRAVLKEMELQATEFAGEYMAAAYTRDDLQKVADFICKVPPDGYHGSAAAQTDAFIQGVQNTRPDYSLQGC